jgi:hypothetical protein
LQPWSRGRQPVIAGSSLVCHRPFAPPKSGRVAVKVINHYGDEAMRVFKVV